MSFSKNIQHQLSQFIENQIPGCGSSEQVLWVLENFSHKKEKNWVCVKFKKATINLRYYRYVLSLRPK